MALHLDARWSDASGLYVRQARSRNEYQSCTTTSRLPKCMNIAKHTRQGATTGPRTMRKHTYTRKPEYKKTDNINIHAHACGVMNCPDPNSSLQRRATMAHGIRLSVRFDDVHPAPTASLDPEAPASTLLWPNVCDALVYRAGRLKSSCNHRSFSVTSPVCISTVKVSVATSVPAARS